MTHGGKRHGTGRKPVPAANNKTVSVVMSEKLHRRIRIHAESAGESVSEWVRKQLRRHIEL